MTYFIEGIRRLGLSVLCLGLERPQLVDHGKDGSKVEYVFPTEKMGKRAKRRAKGRRR